MRYFRHQPIQWDRPDALKVKFEFASRARLEEVAGKLGLAVDDAGDGSFEFPEGGGEAPARLELSGRTLSLMVVSAEDERLPLSVDDLRRAEVIEERLASAGVSPEERAPEA